MNIVLKEQASVHRPLVHKANIILEVLDASARAGEQDHRIITVHNPIWVTIFFWCRTRWRLRNPADGVYDIPPMASATSTRS